VIAGLGTLLGYEACGIEIDGRCVIASRSLLQDHGVDTEILEGTFIPESYAESREMNTDRLRHRPRRSAGRSTKWMSRSRTST
jgi:hypothetical protein